MLSANEYALLEVGLAGVDGAAWEPCRRFADSWLPLPQYDSRSGLSDEVLRANHPDVLVQFDGQRFLKDPDSEWFEFVGKGDGRVKCNNPAAQEKCAQYAEKYSQLKQEARELLRTT